MHVTSHIGRMQCFSVFIRVDYQGHFYFWDHHTHVSIGYWPQGKFNIGFRKGQHFQINVSLVLLVIILSLLLLWGTFKLLDLIKIISITMIILFNGHDEITGFPDLCTTNMRSMEGRDLCFLSMLEGQNVTRLNMPVFNVGPTRAGQCKRHCALTTNTSPCISSRKSYFFHPQSLTYLIFI